MTATAPLPTRLLVPPMQGENQGSYVVRADRALAKKIPDQRARMSRIAQEWISSGREAELQAKVNQALAAVAECDPSQIEEHFVIRRNQPIFKEHETVDAQGRRQRYDRQALAAIVDRCNRRIIETGDLAALSIGHTPDPDQPNAEMPPMVGLSGPFRLGIVNDKKPQWAIFADEAIFKSDWPNVMKRPRRSAEVWMKPNMADRAIDPIAVLGSEPPALDMGLGKYSRRLDPARYRDVMRYSMGSFPGGSNTYPEKYSEPNQGGQMDQQSMTEIVRLVLEGIAATPQWQYLTDQMGATRNPVPESADPGPTPAAAVVDPSNPEGTPADPGAVPSTTADTPETPAAPMPSEKPNETDPPPVPEATTAPPAAEQNPPEGSPTETAKPAESTGEPTAAPTSEKPPEAVAPEPAAEKPKEESGASPEELASMGNEERDEYSRLSPTHQYGYMMARRRHCQMGGNGNGKYSATVERAKYSRLETDNVTLRGEVQALRADKQYRERYSALQALNQIHEFDLDQEANEVKSLTDTQFETHCDRISSRYSRRDPMANMPDLFIEPLEPPEAKTAKAEDEKRARYSQRAVQIAQQAADAGRTITWPDALDQAKKEIG